MPGTKGAKRIAKMKRGQLIADTDGSRAAPGWCRSGRWWRRCFLFPHVVDVWPELSTFPSARRLKWRGALSPGLNRGAAVAGLRGFTHDDARLQRMTRLSDVHDHRLAILLIGHGE